MSRARAARLLLPPTCLAGGSCPCSFLNPQSLGIELGVTLTCLKWNALGAPRSMSKRPGSFVQTRAPVMCATKSPLCRSARSRARDINRLGPKASQQVPVHGVIARAHVREWGPPPKGRADEPKEEVARCVCALVATVSRTPSSQHISLCTPPPQAATPMDGARARRAPSKVAGTMRARRGRTTWSTSTTGTTTTTRQPHPSYRLEVAARAHSRPLVRRKA